MILGSPVRCSARDSTLYDVPGFKPVGDTCSGYSTPLSSFRRLRSARIFPRNPFEPASQVYANTRRPLQQRVMLALYRVIREWRFENGEAASVRLCTAVIAVVIVGLRCNAFVILAVVFPTSGLCLGTVPRSHLFWMLFFCRWLSCIFGVLEVWNATVHWIL